MSDRTFGHKKPGTSTFSNPSLVFPHIPTLANPERGFGLPTNNIVQAQTAESANQQAAQSTDEQSLLSETIQQRSFGHDLSRIAVRRPQAKLTVGEPGDKYEQEADWMANQVMRMFVADKLNAATVQPVQNSLQRECAACEEEEEKVQTKPSIERATDGGLQAGDNIESRLNSSKGGGSALPDEVRSFMEPRFGADFSSVRVHADREAVQMNRDLNAQAFTHGSDVYFGVGKSPGNNELTAHELTHVVQQTGAVQRQLNDEGPKNLPGDPNGRGNQKSETIFRPEWMAFFQQALQGVSGNQKFPTPKQKADIASAIADQCMLRFEHHNRQLLCAMADAPDSDSKTDINSALSLDRTWGDSFKSALQGTTSGNFKLVAEPVDEAANIADQAVLASGVLKKELWDIYMKCQG